MAPIVPHFDLSEESSGTGAHIVNVSGEIHLTTAPRFAQLLTNAIDSGETAVVLDLSAVEFIDSTGLSVLLNGLRQVERRHGRLALVCTNPTVLRLFEVTKLDSTFDIFGDRAAAIAYVTRAQDATSDGSSAGAP